jgi:hypothetical protein
VNFGCESANLLGADDARKERNKSDSRSHDDLDDGCPFDGLHSRPYTSGVVTYIEDLEHAASRYPAAVGYKLTYE